MDKGTFNFRVLQLEVREWASRNFPNAEPWEPLMGAVEELGELAHAHLKEHQGIRTDENHKEAKEDAVGDILIYLADYCWRNGISMAGTIYETWQKVKKRDWIGNTKSGHISNHL